MIRALDPRSPATLAAQAEQISLAEIAEIAKLWVGWEALIKPRKAAGRRVCRKASPPSAAGAFPGAPIVFAAALSSKASRSFTRLLHASKTGPRGTSASQSILTSLHDGCATLDGHAVLKTPWRLSGEGQSSSAQAHQPRKVSTLNEITITLTGNLTQRAPELCYTQGGQTTVSFWIASTLRHQDSRSGAWKDGDTRLSEYRPLTVSVTTSMSRSPRTVRCRRSWRRSLGAQLRRRRPGSRNGYREVRVKITAGPVILSRPKLRGTAAAFASWAGTARCWSWPAWPQAARIGQRSLVGGSGETAIPPLQRKPGAAAVNGGCAVSAAGLRLGGCRPRR